MIISPSLLPAFSLADPVESGEGTIDPLGLEQIAEDMALSLVPGVRERMTHARYLTIMVVGTAICERFGADEVAKDGVSAPWQVYEWYVVEGLARADLPKFTLPGRRKAKEAIRGGFGLARERYLKVPSVFGFHGIYRNLAKELAVVTEDDAVLGINGDDLLTAWIADQQLDGFRGGSGPGADWRRDLHSAVANGMERGATCRPAGWRGWDLISTAMNPLEAGRRERKVLQRLLTSAGGHRATVLEFVASSVGRAALEDAPDGRGLDERRIHLSLRRQADEDLRALLDGIQAYEALARILLDAFHELLHALSSAHGAVALDGLVANPCVRRAAAELPAVWRAAATALGPVGLAGDLEDRFADFARQQAPAQLLRTLVDHHARIQREKLPTGKNAWIDSYSDGRVSVRSGYTRDEPPLGGNRYIHAYRTATLSQFARDLRMVAS